MPIKFDPRYTVSSHLLNNLLRIEAVKQKISHLPLTPTVLRSLRETARLCTTHYSTMIEGNRLNSDQVEVVLKHEGHFPGRERDEQEVKGYYAALEQMETWVSQRTAPQWKMTENMIKKLHALVMSNGTKRARLTPYRDGQNVIRDGATKRIIYMPPEAKDVQELMTALLNWINSSHDLPCPIVAAITHYQFATIHPYYDGNGRTARLLTTLILHVRGYDLKGLYSLEEYYARHLTAYYEAIDIGPSHNYYLGRAEADISKWVEYFIEGMAIAFENVLRQMEEFEGAEDNTHRIRSLDPRQRKALELFDAYDVITSHQIGQLFGFKPRTCSALCASWVKNGFLVVVDPSNKGRKYRLASQYRDLEG